MKTTDYFRYSVSVWLTSLFVSPAVLILATEGPDLLGNPLGGLGFLFLAVLYGGFFSLPNWILLTMGVAAADRLPWSEPARRLVIQLWATLLTFGLFSLINDGKWLNADDFDFLLPLVYFATISFGIWAYDLKPRREEAESELIA